MNEDRDVDKKEIRQALSAMWKYLGIFGGDLLKGSF